MTLHTPSLLGIYLLMLSNSSFFKVIMNLLSEIWFCDRRYRLEFRVYYLLLICIHFEVLCLALHNHLVCLTEGRVSLHNELDHFLLGFPDTFSNLAALWFHLAKWGKMGAKNCSYTNKSVLECEMFISVTVIPTAINAITILPFLLYFTLPTCCRPSSSLRQFMWG